MGGIIVNRFPADRNHEQITENNLTLNAGLHKIKCLIIQSGPVISGVRVSHRLRQFSACGAGRCRLIEFHWQSVDRVGPPARPRNAVIRPQGPAAARMGFFDGLFGRSHNSSGGEGPDGGSIHTVSEV